jgi:hypothetical protein
MKSNVKTDFNQMYFKKVLMKAYIIVLIVFCLSCSNDKSANATKAIEDSNKDELLFEDTTVDAQFIGAMERKNPENFDIASFEYDTLDLPLNPSDTSIRILTIGQFHGDEVWPDAMNQDWIGLFVNDSNSYLRKVNTKFERIKDVVLDEG